jgi:hypothetical protein
MKNNIKSPMFFGWENDVKYIASGRRKTTYEVEEQFSKSEKFKNNRKPRGR